MNNISPRQLAYIEAIAKTIRDHMGDDDDLQTFLDTLDGETDAKDYLASLTASAFDDDAMCAALAAQIEVMQMRKDRIESRAKAYKAAALAVMTAAGLKKVELPRVTISIRAGSESVLIDNEADIPSQLMTVKTTTSPDKMAIKAQLKAGETVPGASLVRGPDAISLRVK